MKAKNLFAVEVLDTRLGPKNGGVALPDAQPAKWNTPEYYIYFLAFLTIPVLMFKSVYDVSQPDHPGFSNYEGLLDEGWIPGRKVDNSDLQYRGFRDNIPYMAAVLVAHPLLRRVYEWFTSGSFTSGSSGPDPSSNGVKRRDASAKSPAADTRLAARINFDLGFAAVFLIALHGISALKILLILCVNYEIATALPKRYVGLVTWTFNVGILLANELCQGYPLAWIARLLLADSASQSVPFDGGWTTWLDGFGGLIPRWEVLFKITILRLIAFNFDYLWMQDRQASSPVEKKNLDPANLSERERLDHGARPADFTFRNYLAYILYSPLYLAGPIVNFNDYISQLRHQLPSVNMGRIAPYFVRFVLCLLTMELVQHYLYAVAISRSSPDWNLYTPFQLSMLGYFNLHIIWLKLLLPWRFFRLWALLDRFDPPENMVRCMSDNYSALSFWRGWHRSYNLWIMRYIYIPLGGSRGLSRARSTLNYLLVFTFVALWHDINLRLLLWGWMVVLFVLPEFVAGLLFPAKQWKTRPNAYRWLCGVGATGNILMMMAANLVGFAVGLDGLQGLVDGIVGSFGGRLFLVAACATLFVGSQVMFEVREAEKRRGIHLKY